MSGKRHRAKCRRCHKPMQTVASRPMCKVCTAWQQRKLESVRKPVTLRGLLDRFKTPPEFMNDPERLARIAYYADRAAQGLPLFDGAKYAHE